jgi:glycosyltransferase involved in cell wall biosynthesis
MDAGLPVISTDVGGVGEIIKDGVTGLLAPTGDDAALAGHVLRLCEDRTLGRGLGGFGQERARELFSEEKMHTGYVRLYEEMLRA